MNRETILIGVAGAGSMGNGIAQLAAMAGFRVRLSARRAAGLDDALQNMADSLTKLYEKGLITEEPTVILARITPCYDFMMLSDCGLVIEAIAEQMELKSELLSSVGAALGKDAILASSTSSLSITALGQASGIPGRFIGMHFMNPVPLMEVVELISGEQTAPETISFAQQMIVALGKQFVCSKDQPGFIITRLLCVLINEAFEMLQSGVADAEAIDSAMHLGAHHPMGPLALADMIGLDCDPGCNRNPGKRSGQPQICGIPPAAGVCGTGQVGQEERPGGLQISLIRQLALPRFAPTPEICSSKLIPLQPINSPFGFRQYRLLNALFH